MGAVGVIERRQRPAALAGIALLLVINLPFVLFHPDSPLVEAALPRSLAINYLLFLAPGLPLAGAMLRLGVLPRPSIIWIVALSFAASALVLVTAHAAGKTPTAGFVWTGTWIVTNAALALNWIVGGRLELRAPRHFWVAVALFSAAYPVYLHAATHVVPTTRDHDFEVQGTAYALVSRLKPGLETTRGTEYYFAHPPLLHAYVAGSFLYYGQLDELAVYDPEVSRNIDELKNVRDLDQFQLYLEEPFWLETRTPNVYLAAITVALLGWWIAAMTGRPWLGLLAAVAYATVPDVFIRSGYGGYFAIDQYALVTQILASAAWLSRRDRFTAATCLVAGAFAAVADHKLALLPIAIVLWEWWRRGNPWNPVEAVRAALHPVVVGFAAGTALFWAYGLWVSPYSFWMDHVRHHLVDRALNINARGMDLSRYPTVRMLWGEFWEHTGYLLLPIGMLALAACCWSFARRAVPEPTKEDPSWQSIAGLWAIAAVVIAIAFSLVDWRQTKHLMPLIPLLFLGITRVGSMGRMQLVLASCVLSGILVWNGYALYTIWDDPFELMKKIPEW